MTNRFLISAAVAALIAGTGFANAQGTGTSHEGASGAAPTQQSAPATEHAAPPAAPKKDLGASTGMKGAESQGMKGSENSGMKASQSNEKAQPGTSTSKSAQDNNAMPGQKSKSMSSENETKGGKDMKAEGRDSKSGTTNAAESRDSKTGNMNAQTRHRQQVADHDRQRGHVGDRGTAGRKAHPDRFRHQVGEDRGDHQRQLQHFGRRDGPDDGTFPSAARPDRRNLSGVAWLRCDLRAWPVHHRPAADPRDRLHHRGLRAFERSALGAGRNARPFSVAAGILKHWLMSDFRRFHTAFYELDEALGTAS